MANSPGKRERTLYEISSAFFAGCVIVFAVAGIAITLSNGDGPGSAGFIISVVFLLLGLGRLYLDQLGIFPGSLGNYGGVHKGMPVVTIELPSALRTPMDVEMRQMWLDLRG